MHGLLSTASDLLGEQTGVNCKAKGPCSTVRAVIITDPVEVTVRNCSLWCLAHSLILSIRFIDVLALPKRKLCIQPQLKQFARRMALL